MFRSFCMAAASFHSTRKLRRTRVFRSDMAHFILAIIREYLSHCLNVFKRVEPKANVAARSSLNLISMLCRAQARSLEKESSSKCCSR